MLCRQVMEWREGIEDALKSGDAEALRELVRDAAAPSTCTLAPWQNVNSSADCQVSRRSVPA